MPSCFWFMVCANYFPNMASQIKEETFRRTLSALSEREFPLISRLNKQMLKTTAKPEIEDKSLILEIGEKMSRKFDEVIHNRGVMDLGNNDEFYSNSKHFPLKSAFNKEDDDFIIQMRKYGIEKYNQYFPEEERGAFSNYNKMAGFKQLPLEYVIELLSIDREELKTTNMQKIGEIQKAFFNEDVDQLLAEREYMDPENILKDLEFMSTTEIEFLNYLEQKQQINLALMNTDVYDDDKNDKGSNYSSEGSNPKNDKNENYDLTNGDFIQEKPCMDSLNETKLNNETNVMTIELNNPPPVNNEETSPENNNDNVKKESHATQVSKTHKVIKDDIVCQVCNDGDYSEDNMIVFCSVETPYINKFELNYFKEMQHFGAPKMLRAFKNTSGRLDLFVVSDFWSER